MVISASRRTDIPAYYSDWFLDRIQERCVSVKNPFNAHQTKEISLEPHDIDCIVFWSKNPAPLLDSLQLLDDYGYAYYFQFTLNPYDQDIEPGLPSKSVITETFKKLSGKIGPQRVIWRYDPVLLNDRYTAAYHIDNFGKMAHNLKGYTERVTFSFIDFYGKITEKIAACGIAATSTEEKKTLAENFSKAAVENNLLIETCAEDIDLSEFNIGHARCVDGGLIAKITGRDFSAQKDKNQRPDCGCAKSVDIGAYNSCPGGCVYCYANSRRRQACPGL
jgi:hypothetical protein